MAIKIKFNVPAQIKNVAGKRETFKPGTYDLDEEVMNHWFIQGLVASGQAEVLEQATKPKPIEPKLVESKQQELLFAVPAAPTAVRTVEQEKSISVNLKKERGIEIEEIKPSVSKKKMEVKESIAAAPVEEVKKASLRRRKRT